ncbi:MAG: DeoR/GlpR transcriptional regulator, partial [Lentisphaerae bacterium]|nr:DeoR/GlpR transcriptional regulator [Lentisphaerota bacterium]
MKPRQRQEQILQRLRALPREWQVEELARALKVSALTIRRDLEELARGGLILRTHGGCLDSGRGAAASDYQRRVAVNFELKQAIGAEAARQVRAHNALLI